MRNHLRFHILGPLEVWGERRVRINSRRDRVVLSMLLLKPDQIVSVDRLIDGVWKDYPPTTARRQIQSCIMRLRRSLCPDGDGEIIETAHPGYVLERSDHFFDHYEFVERMSKLVSATERGAMDWPAISRGVRGALSLWRGHALDGVVTPLVEGEAARLDEMRLAAVEWLMDAELLAGKDCELIGELIPLTNNYPYRERFRQQLMIAQYRAGRRGDALTTYRTTRQLMLDEIGTEPGDELRMLHDAVLHDDLARIVVRIPWVEGADNELYSEGPSFVW
ncbi:AfsR/SARP family transcriptional regulator [Nocardia arthritidis]|uniref:OmpR/PhoB-type domain-containing protein n=1 Tax=Nocardia arthritidis TaxID=228602 RepID=A0A6G9YEY9_9NOCA|nr:AfsR/SARP family transcriptional regulator [Nocardia arthritidis]QIS11563.1 hypothetical protein F5544_18445 [Nocardia arthritidis]